KRSFPGRFFNAYKSGKRENQASQNKPVLGKDAVSMIPLTAAKNTWILVILFFCISV
ncbi:MAG: hypothetical protein JRI53_12310, partial [Deltaproteobacteria bacterium]|nr:hypothetical protein [Deltaproteobacteria bacterium]